MKGDIRFLKQRIASFITKMNLHGIDIYTHIHESNDYHVYKLNGNQRHIYHQNPSNKKQTTNIPMNHPTILRANPIINPMEIPTKIQLDAWKVRAHVPPWRGASQPAVWLVCGLGNFPGPGPKTMSFHGIYWD